MLFLAVLCLSSSSPLFSFHPTINWHHIILLLNSDSPEEALFLNPPLAKWKAGRYCQEIRLESCLPFTVGSSLLAPLAGCKSAGPEVEPSAVPWGLLCWLQWHIKGVLGSSWLPLPVLSPFSSFLPLLLHATWPSSSSPSLLDVFKPVH